MANAQLIEEDSADVVDESAQQYLTFIMANEEYGVDILCVQEIRGWEAVTPLPNAPSHIKGVINLRGTIVPIVDLRECFGLDRVEYTPLTVVIVLKIQTEQGARVMGVVVDAVSDVYAISDTDLRHAPDLGDCIDTEYIKGLVTISDKMIILLAMNKLLSMDELPDLADVNQLVANTVDK